MNKLISTAAGITALLACAVTQAQPYPSRTVRIVVPYVAGGASDVMARVVVSKAIADMGQQGVVDNRAGGNATIGMQMVARAAPDGYTLGVVDAAFTIAPSVQVNLPYNPVNDFEPVTMLATTALILVVHPSLPVKKISELVTLAKARPGQLTYSSTGSGTNTHLAFAQIKLATGMDAIHVPYKGGAAQITALLSGEVSFALAGPAAISPQIRAGRARALAVTGAQRLAAFQDVPTLNELGLRVVVTPFYGVVAPAGTPAEIVSRLNQILVKQLRSPELAPRLSEMQFEAVGNSPEEFSAFIRSEIPKWVKVVKATGAKVD